jgi:hypothetical protein
MKAWLVAAVVVAGLSGCSSSEEMSRSPVLPGDPAPESSTPLPPLAESDDDASLDHWKSTVLDRADDDTVELIRRDLEARIKRLKDSDERLSYLPPGIALEERGRVQRRMAFEKRRLELVDAR